MVPVCLFYYIYDIQEQSTTQCHCAPLSEKLSKLDQLSFVAKKRWAKVQYYIYVTTSMSIVQVRPTPWLHNRYSGTQVHSNHIRYMMHLRANKFGAFDPVYQCEKLATVYLKSITV